MRLPGGEKPVLLEVISIVSLLPSPATTVEGEVLAIWEGEQVREVLALVGDVPGSELHRCFAPRYGIRAHGTSDLLFEIAFCFHCHGALLLGPGVPADQRGIHSFDPDSAAGNELLERFSEVNGV
ncbi:hypothetical protein ABZ832_23260 [Streptantibioticus parmotrematis]|uniref:hypothetical protein n=1 Tax=Streptantibioticus parmotrematis TaxID=2873249 RepID=UPI0033DB4EDC